MRQLNISKATARRDIEELSSQGLIQRPGEGAMCKPRIPGTLLCKEGIQCR